MIEGELVRLRAPEADDLERCHRWMNDPEVTRFLTARYPISMRKEQEWLDQRIKEGNNFENVVLAIELKEEGTHVGTIGLHRASAEDRTAGLGIVIGEKGCWAKGYGTDAIRTLLRFAFEQMNLHCVWLWVYDFNERAQACYRRCGFVDEGRMREAHYAEGRYSDHLVMGILRREWQEVSDQQAAKNSR